MTLIYSNVLITQVVLKDSHACKPKSTENYLTEFYILYFGEFKTK